MYYNYSNIPMRNSIDIKYYLCEFTNVYSFKIFVWSLHFRGNFQVTGIHTTPHYTSLILVPTSTIGTSTLQKPDLTHPKPSAPSIAFHSLFSAFKPSYSFEHTCNSIQHLL